MNEHLPMSRSRLPRFSSQMEHEFHLGHYERIRPTLRMASALLAAMFMAYAARDFSDTRSLALSLMQDGAPAIFFATVFALTWSHPFSRSWQPFIVLGGLAAAAISLAKMASFLAVAPKAPDAAATAFSADSLFFGQQIRLLMICTALTRLQFRWVVGLQTGLLCIGTINFVSSLLTSTPTANDISRFLQPTLAVLAAVLLAAWTEENLSRRAFWASHQLEEERNDERRKREQTEKTLHVLAQAIGGIVHDLGNPLTTVQMGASTLDLFLDQEEIDREALHHITGMIGKGAQMLNHLRLSLIEQTRVLEGKPTPVDIKPTDLRAVIEAGARFQKPHALGCRAIRIEGDDRCVCVDEMKMITVFMNLIANALKYSDGAVDITWRADDAHRQASDGKGKGERMLCVAIFDAGTCGRGITREQAGHLFTAFGRLETHAAIEGTGLGLLSVQKIVQAQGGEAFIQGYEDGTPDTPIFSTARGLCPTMLSGEHRTAFVVSCPLAAAP